MMKPKVVSEYVTQVETVVNQFSINEKKLPVNQVVEKNLRSLTNEFKNVICAIEELKDLSTLQ